MDKKEVLFINWMHIARLGYDTYMVYVINK